MARRIRVITDSVADLPYDLACRWHIKVVPVPLVMEGRSYLDDASLDREWFYNSLARGVIPKTAAPPPNDFLKAYRALVDEGAELILGLFTASGMSSIYTHALLAAQQMPGGSVRLFDTGQVTMGLGWLVLMTAEALASGASLGQLEALIHRWLARTRVLGVVDALEHLRQSGRVGWVTARLGELLQIKPLIGFEAGEATLLGRVRTHQRARQRLVELVRSAAPLERLAILHSRAAPDALARFQEALTPFAPSRTLPEVEIGPVFAAHVGPGCLGVAYVGGA